MAAECQIEEESTQTLKTLELLSIENTDNVVYHLFQMEELKFISVTMSFD